MIIGKIPKVYDDDRKVENSNRGPYIIIEEFKYNEFTVEELTVEFKKWHNASQFFKLVESEMEMYSNNDIEGLREHPFWKGDEAYLLDGYIKLHTDFIKKMDNEKYPSSRNICAANADTCMTLLQRNNDTLYSTSRSCDISLGYLADLYTLYLYAVKYNLKNIVWTINTPHIYKNNLRLTSLQFLSKTKNRQIIFNKRKEV